MWQYMLDKDHFYDLRDLPVGHWSTSKLQMTKNSIWMHFHEPNSKKYYNTSNPIDFKKPYIPPPRTTCKTKSHSSISTSTSDNNSPRCICDNNSFAITNDNLQIMNEEDAYRNPKPIIPVVGTYGKKMPTKTRVRSKNDHRTLKDLASMPTTSRSVRTIRSLTSTPTNAKRNITSRSNISLDKLRKSKNSNQNHSSKTNYINNYQSFNQKSPNDDKNQKIYYSLKKNPDDNQTEIELSDLKSEEGKKNEINNSNLISNLNDDLENKLHNVEKVIFVHSSQEDREAAQAKRTLQVLERKERKYDPQIPSFTVCGNTTVISNSADIDSHIATNKAVIFSDDLPEPPLYIDKRYGDNSHKNPLRISQIEIRKQFKEALENGKLDDYNSDYEYEIEEIFDNDNTETRNSIYPSRPSTAKPNRYENRIRTRNSSRSRSSTINTRRNLYKSRYNYRNEDNDNDDTSGDTPMLSRKQYFNSASKIPNIGSLASDL